jgi:glucosamine--fructose-6-phosphate aminotransferase (isomerizing)
VDSNVCGIIAVVRRPSDREPTPAPALLADLEAVRPLLAAGDADRVGRLEAAATALESIDAALRGVPGLLSLRADRTAAARLAATVDELGDAVAVLEAELDDPHTAPPAGQLEAVNAALLRCKDALWAVSRDRLRAVRGVEDLLGPAFDAEGGGPAGLAVALSLHQALSALDRLEVRGRDSAGLEVQLTGHGLDAADPQVRAALAARDGLAFTDGSVRLVDGVLVVVHKAAAEIGELGDNTAALRAAIRADDLLQRALRSSTVDGLVLGHTRWASIGIISEPNAHPQSSDELGRTAGAFVTAVLNGDVDNHADLVAADGLAIPVEITTDAKVIPALVSRGLDDGLSSREAFREAVARLEGSVAIGAAATAEPDRLLLALRGSGQALYVGVADEAFIVASEPYGLVEETATYLRLDGETPADPDNPVASRGQIVELSAARAGTVEGIGRWSYDGTALPVTENDLTHAQITTRDIDRGEFPHFLLKEITDAPASFRKTLRGKLIEADGTFRVELTDDSLPLDVREGLRSGRLARVLVIGQGTAAVAGQSLAEHLRELLAETEVRVEALPATELSGFRLRGDMSDTLAVAISQSGTTTDTNRTVDLLRGRGASVVSIVNRRNSDLTDKSDGVLYTSDGRDVEMSVASTKAFYAQVAAGLILGYAISQEVPGARTPAHPEEQELLRALAEVPAALEATLATRPAIAEAARTFAPSRRYWAIVGNGPNQIAARELRIKLSELCYKSIACDATEDKKHIDLSSEPMILVCAAGLVGSTADDVSKEVAIFRAHKAAPIVIASEGDRAFGAALAVLTVPDTHPRLGFVLATMVGHLFGYEAALSIDAQARPLREVRAAVDEAVSSLGGDLQQLRDGEGILRRLRPVMAPAAATFMDGLRSGAYDGHLEAGTAVRVAGLFRYALGISPLDAYQVEFGKVGTPGVVLEDLVAGLTAAIEELTRPVDAIKHQAKTVTVGISRSDESLLQVPLVLALLEAGSPRDRLAYSTLRSLGELDPAIVEVVGSTRYAVEHGEDLARAQLVVVDRRGVSASLPSRVDRDHRLRGTKALVAREQELMVARGRADGRLVVIVPETKDGVTTGLQLLHVVLPDHLPAATARAVLQGYRRRYQALKDAVTETEDVFRDDLLAQQSVADLLTVPILDLADRWRS